MIPEFSPLGTFMGIEKTRLHVYRSLFSLYQLLYETESSLLHRHADLITISFIDWMTKSESDSTLSLYEK
jgi:hypothetical protein